MSRDLIRACGWALLGVVPLLSGCASSADQAATATRAQADQEAAALKAQADQAASNKEVMHTFIGLFQSGKWDDLGQVIANDCVLHYPGGVDVVGLDAMKAGWQVSYGALKNMNATSQAEISEGDILMDFLTFEATYEGEYLGQQISGVPVKYNQVEMVRIANGKIVEWWVEMDRLWMSEQLGFELRPR
jgi:predicted ester cyclase